MNNTALVRDFKSLLIEDYRKIEKPYKKGSNRCILVDNSQIMIGDMEFVLINRTDEDIISDLEGREQDFDFIKDYVKRLFTIKLVESFDELLHYKLTDHKEVDRNFKYYGHRRKLGTIKYDVFKKIFYNGLYKHIEEVEIIRDAKTIISKRQTMRQIKTPGYLHLEDHTTYRDIFECRYEDPNIVELFIDYSNNLKNEI